MFSKFGAGTGVFAAVRVAIVISTRANKLLRVRFEARSVSRTEYVAVIQDLSVPLARFSRSRASIPIKLNMPKASKRGDGRVKYERRSRGEERMGNNEYGAGVSIAPVMAQREEKRAGTGRKTRTLLPGYLGMDSCQFARL